MSDEDNEIFPISFATIRELELSFRELDKFAFIQLTLRPLNYAFIYIEIF